MDTSSNKPKNQRPAVFPCGEHYGSIGTHSNNDYCKNGFVKTGEFRAPQKGEWYLSGAIPAAYRAKADLNTSYQILAPVEAN